MTLLTQPQTSPNHATPEVPSAQRSDASKFDIHPYQPRGRKRGKALQYVADFETTTKVEDCRVWGWGFVGIRSDWESIKLSEVQVGQDIDSFFEVASSQNSIIYFHNLRFDGRFVLDYLFREGFRHVHEGSLRGTFSTLISDMGQFYSITVRWGNGFHTEFRDSYKKIPLSVDRIAKAFKMDYLKGDLDYELERPPGWVITPEEADYIRRDVWIVARALGQELAQGMQKLTVGADALFEFRRLYGPQNFERTFPVLSISMDAEIRRAYRGGFTYADPRFSGRLCGSGLVLDVNSLYPSVMYYKPIPIGEPEFVSGFPESTPSKPLTIFSVTFTASIKPNHIPCIQIKGSSRFVPTEYLSVIDEPTTLMVTNIDWQLMNDHYDLEVLEYGGGWRFRAANGIFDEYIDKWMKIKAASVGGMREIAKLHLNSLYGKFATNPNVTGKFPVLDPATNTVQLKAGPYEERNPVYTAAGVFITSYARDITIRAAQSNYYSFAYADTDSLHLLSDTLPNNIRIHPSELGAWKHEYNFDSAFYIRAKAYLERTTEGQYHNAIAGIPVDMSSALTFEHLVPGTVLEIDDGKVIRITREDIPSVILKGKLNPKPVPGGVVLSDVPFELTL